MELIIKETGERTELSILDPINGTEFILDFIGNHNGFGSEDGQFDFDEIEEVHTCTQETFDWWDTVITGIDELNDRLEELTTEHGTDTINDVIYDAAEGNLEDHAPRVNAALDAAGY